MFSRCYTCSLVLSPALISSAFVSISQILPATTRSLAQYPRRGFDLKLVKLFYVWVYIVGRDLCLSYKLTWGLLQRIAYINELYGYECSLQASNAFDH